MGKGSFKSQKQEGEMPRLESRDGNNKPRQPNPSQLEKESAAAIDAAENEGLPVAGEPLPFTAIPAAELDSFIRARAYEIYEQECREDGHAEQHWHQAQSEILRRR